MALNRINKRGVDCGHHNPISLMNKPSSCLENSAAATTAALAAQPSVGNGSSSASSQSGAANTRMGSRRIFSPQFKLQVLDSFRNDSECKGNQRATARKYNIHRRQIQKWLQCEDNLRATVANYNQNNVKHHQFHNITHHQMTVSTSCTAATAVGVAPTAASTTTPAPAIAQASTIVNTHTTSGAYVHNNNNNLYHHRHSQTHQPYKTALDTARHSVALTSSTAAATVRLNAAVAAPSKCMNGQPLIQPGAQTNTISIHQPYNQTPAIKPVRLIQLHHQHQTSLHQHHHHQLLHSQRQHENVLMPTACLPELPAAPANVAHEILDYPPVPTNLHRPQAQRVHEYIRLCPVNPIDLSVGPKRFPDHEEPMLIHPRTIKAELKWHEPQEPNNNEQKVNIKVETHVASPIPTSVSPSHAVDLTCRKRSNYIPHPSSPSEKVLKTDEELNADVDRKVTSKPVKLFKPYLPNNEDPEESSEQQDAIIWSNHPAASIGSPGYETQSNHSSNFQSPTCDPAFTFPLGSPNSISSTSSTTATINKTKFQNSSTSPSYDRVSPSSGVIHSATSPSAAASVVMWGPKGSPVSGYDTASTCSDSSEPHQSECLSNQTSSYEQHRSMPPAARYVLDVKVESIESSDYYQPHSHHHNELTTCRSGAEIQSAPYPSYSVRYSNDVQRWLQDHREHRPGIALYV